MSTDKIQALEEALAEVFSEPHVISTNTEQSSPIFDHPALAEIFSEPLSLSTSTTPSPPSFDHQALAEIFSERPPVSIDPQSSPFSFDTWSLPPPLFGQLDNGEPVAKTVAGAPSTSTETARSQRAASFLAKLRHIFSTKAESLSSSIEKDSSPPTVAGWLNNVEPAVKTHSLAAPTDAETTRSQQAKSLLVEPLPATSTNIEPSPPIFGEEPSRPIVSGRLDKVEPAEKTDVESAQPQQPNSSLTELPPLISINTETSPVIPEKETSRPTLSSQLSNLESAAKTASVAPPTDAESLVTQPREAKPLLSEVPSLDSTNTKAQALYIENEPSPISLSGQPDHPEPAAKIVAAAPAADAEDPPLQHGKSLLAELPPSRSVFEGEPSPTTLSVEPDNAAPAVKSVAVAPPTHAVGMEATNTKPSSSFEEAPSRPSFYGRPDNVGPAVTAVADSLSPTTDGALTRTQLAKSLLAELDLNTAIRLRWVLRDIRGKRTAISPASENDLATLIDLGLVEMREKLPSLTALGVLALD